MILAAAPFALADTVCEDVVIESWEDWPYEIWTFDGFDDITPISKNDPMYGSAVTHGDWAAAMDFQVGWHQGLTLGPMMIDALAGLSGAAALLRRRGGCA